MNREFNPASAIARCVSAVAAVLAMFLTGASIEGLVDHYNASARSLTASTVAIAVR